MARGLAPAIEILTRTLVGRMKYLGNTGRLTEASRQELTRLEAELEILGATMRDIDRLAAVPLQTHAAVVAAYRQELARYGALVVADNRQAREHSAMIREAARKATEASQRARLKRRLRVTRATSDPLLVQDPSHGS